MLSLVANFDKNLCVLVYF